MTNNIIESKYFDIVVSASKDYKGDDVYIIRYGLQVSKEHSLGGALMTFEGFLFHARQCEGLNDE